VQIQTGNAGGGGRRRSFRHPARQLIRAFAFIKRAGQTVRPVFFWGIRKFLMKLFVRIFVADITLVL
jgi:hypothetical protein